MAEPVQIYANLFSRDIAALEARIQSPEFVEAVARKAASSSYSSIPSYHFISRATYTTGSSGNLFSVNKVEITAYSETKGAVILSTSNPDRSCSVLMGLTAQDRWWDNIPDPCSSYGGVLSPAIFFHSVLTYFGL